MTDPYSLLFRTKQFGDRNLHALATENIDQLDAFEGSIVLRVLDHIHAVDRIFQHHLLGTPHEFQAARSETLPELAQLVEAGRELGDWYVDYVEGLSPADLDQPLDFTFTSGKPTRMTRGEILLHVCTHGTYHRGNVGILFQKKGIAPGADGVTGYLETANA